MTIRLHLQQASVSLLLAMQAQTRATALVNGAAQPVPAPQVNALASNAAAAPVTSAAPGNQLQPIAAGLRQGEVQVRWVLSCQQLLCMSLACQEAHAQ